MSDAPSLDALAAAAAEHLAALDAPRAADDLSGLRHVGERLAASNALAAASVATARGLVAAVDALRAEQTDADALRRSWGVSFNSLSDLRTAVIGLASGAALPPPEVLDERHGPNVADALRKLDALRAAEARRDALAAAVRDVGNLIAEHGCSCDCDCTHTTGEHTSACDPCLACRASDVVSPLLSGCAADVVRARVVRAYLDADREWQRSRVRFIESIDAAAVERTERLRVERETKRAALDAALAAAEGR